VVRDAAHRRRNEEQRLNLFRNLDERIKEPTALHHVACFVHQIATGQRPS